MSEGVIPTWEVASGKTMSSIVGIGGIDGGVGSAFDEAIDGSRAAFRDPRRRRGETVIEST